MRRMRPKRVSQALGTRVTPALQEGHALKDPGAGVGVGELHAIERRMGTIEVQLRLMWPVPMCIAFVTCGPPMTKQRVRYDE